MTINKEVIQQLRNSQPEKWTTVQIRDLKQLIIEGIEPTTIVKNRGLLSLKGKTASSIKNRYYKIQIELREQGDISE